MFPLRFWGAVAEVLVLSAVSLAVMAAIYPDLLVHQRIRFTGGHDIELPFEAAFTLAHQLLNGGLQLWNRFDQVNHGYLHLTTGFYTLPALLEAWVFAKIYPFLDRPGEAFYRLHALMFHGMGILFRTIGGYAVLSLFTTRWQTRVLSLLILNTLLSTQAFNGVVVGFVWSLSLLGIYALVRFSRLQNMGSLLLFTLIMTVAVANIPLLAVGYFYQALHFLLLAAVAAVLLARYRPRFLVALPGLLRAAARRVAAYGGQAATAVFARARRTRPSLVSLLAHEWTIRTPGIDVAQAIRKRGVSIVIPALSVRLRVRTVFLAGLCIGAVLPVIVYTGVLARIVRMTTAVAGSASSRFDQVLNPFATMLWREREGTQDLNFLNHIFTFDQNGWAWTWVFVGSAVVALCVIGGLFSRNRSKHLIVTALLCFYLLNFLGWGMLPTLPVHLVNAFTNPFYFLVRGLHMTSLVMPFMLLPLVALGIDALWDLYNGRGRRDGWRFRWAIGVFAVLAAYCLAALPWASGAVAGAMFLGAAALVFTARRPAFHTSFWRWAAMAAVCLGVVADMRGLVTYYRQVPYTGDRIAARTFIGLEALGPLVIDYQNPATAVLPRYVRADPMPRTVSTDPSAPPGSDAAYFCRQCYIGQFYHAVFASRVLEPRRLYDMRHAGYAEAASDKTLARDLQTNPRYIFHAETALSGTQASLREIVAANANDRVVLLDRPDQAFPENPIPADNWDGRRAPPAAPPPLRLTLDLGAAALRVRDGFDEYVLPLPPDFPMHMATSIFTRDVGLIRAHAAGRDLTPAQGHLIRPFTFDVNNVVRGALTVALPRAAGGAMTGQVALEVDRDPLVTQVWRNEADNLGITYQAPSDGWMVIRNPYEGGWHATVNGKPEFVWAANKTSMAVAVEKGENRILLQYKPPELTRHRPLLKAFIFHMSLLTFWIVWFALRDATIQRRRVCK